MLLLGPYSSNYGHLLSGCVSGPSCLGLTSLCLIIPVAPCFTATGKGSGLRHHFRAPGETGRFLSAFPPVGNCFCILPQPPAVGRAFGSRTCLVPTGEFDAFRLVIELSWLNKFNVHRLFRILTIRRIRLSLHLGWWFASVVLSLVHTRGHVARCETGLARW